MKKIYSLIILCVLLCYAGSAWGDELTVADKTNYNSYVPIYGSWMDAYTRCQVIYLSSELAAMNGKSITSMTFYLKSNPSKAWSGSEYHILLSEVTASAFSGSWNTETAGTEVLTCASLDGTSGTMTLTFTTSYTYNGGNLLFELQDKGAGEYAGASFYGDGSLGTRSVSNYNSTSFASVAAYNRAFLPKTTFTYEDGAPVTCPKPSDLTQGTVTHNSAAFTWTAGGSEASWQYVYLPAATTLTDEAWSGATAGSVNTAAVTLSDLSAATDYKLYVRAYCSSSDQSANISKQFRTNNAMPFSEDFTGLTSGNIPSGWDNTEGTTSTASYRWNYNNSGHDAAPCVRFNSSTNGSGNTNTLKTPTIYIDKAAALSFWYKNPSGGDFSVYYSIDGVKQASALATGLTGATDWTNYEVNLPAACVGHNVMILFEATSNYGNSSAYIYLDDVVIEAASSCAKPSALSAYATSGTTANVSWTAGGEETTWNLQFSTDNFSTFTERTGVTSNPYNLTDLSAQTTYKVRIQADCGGAQSGWIASSEFTTPCAAVDGIGWSENFESATAGGGNIPDCWQKISNTNGDLQVSNTSYYQKEGSAKCLYFYSGTTTTPRIAIFPPFNEPTNTLQVVLEYAQAFEAWGTLYDYTDEDYGQLSIGYITNPKDASTFVTQETLPRVSTYTQAKVALTNAPAGSRVALRYGGGSNSGYLLVDNASITALPTCLTPTSVTGAATAYNQASISWSANGSESAWKVRYSSNNGSSWSGEIAASTNPFTLTGLSGNSDYIVQVKADCGGETSDWSASSPSFHTPCAPADASDYSETFESATVGEGNLPDCWQYKDAYDDYWDGRYPQVYNNGAYQGSKLLYFYGGGAESVNTVLLPTMDETLDGLTVEFYYNTSVNFSTIVYGSPVLGYIAADGTTFVEIETLAQSGEYIMYKKDLSSVPATAKNIAISYAKGTAGSGHMYLDNVRVYPTPSCLDPTGVTVSNVTATTADVAWTENNGKSTWKLQISNDGSAWTDVNGGADITANPYTLTNLTPNHTTYYVRVKTICGVGDESPWSASSASFETECGTVALPFSENFNAPIPCWTMTNCVANTGINSNRFRFYYGYASQYLISPEIEAAGKQVTVEFDYSVYSTAETFMVGYSTTTNATSAFTWGAEQTATNTSVLRYSENLPAGVKYVAIQYTSYDKYYLYIDNFSVTEYIAPSCPVVSAATLQESDVTAHTATVSWTAAGEETAWNLQYKADGGEWSSVIPVATTPSHDLSSLAANTLYYVRVQADCGGDGTGDWTGDDAFSFRTDCDPQAVSVGSPWNYGFETTDGATVNTVPSCWAVSPEGYDSYTYALVDNEGQKTGAQCFHIKVYNNDSKIVILPVFSEEIKNLKIAFAYDNGSTSTNYGRLELGYVKDGAFTRVGDFYGRVEGYASISATDMPNDAPDGARIAFRLAGIKTSGGYSSHAYIDDIVVSRKPSCEVPTAIAAEATSNGANVSWTDDAASQWSLRYSVKDADSWTTVNDIDVTNRTISGLTANTEYEVQVKAVCGVSDESAWSASAFFETVCGAAPSGLTANNRTTNSVTLSWTGSESAFKLQTSLDNDTWSDAINVNAKTYNLTGLSAGNTYYARVQNACGGEFATLEFTTICAVRDAVSLPLEEDFTSVADGELPACWESETAAVETGENNKLFFRGADDQLVVLPGYNIELNKLTVSFDYSTNFSNMQFGYVTSLDGTFVSLANLEGSTYDADLASTEAPASAGYLAIRYYNTSSSFANGTIDNIVVRRTPSCSMPTGLAATPGVGSAEISWTAGGSETAWNLQYKKNGAADWNNVAVSTNPYVLNDLEQGINYKVRVQAACAGEDLSDWTDEIDFTTQCSGIADIPWDADFSANLSDCWTIHCESPASYSPMISSEGLQIPGGNTGHSNVVVLPGFTPSLTPYTITLRYKCDKNAGNATPQIGYVTSKDNASTFAVLLDGTDAEIGTLEKSSGFKTVYLPLSALPGTATNLAIKYADGTSEGDLIINEFRISHVEIFEDLSDADNVTRLAALNGQTLDAVFERPILRNGDYNTLCLPFNLSAAQLADDKCPLNGFQVREYDHTDIDLGASKVDIFLRTVSAVEAGKACFVRLEGGTLERLEWADFRDVTITASEVTNVDDNTAGIHYIGVFNPYQLSGNNSSNLYLSTGNALYIPASNIIMNGFRAYFGVDAGGPASAPIRRGAQVRIVEHKDSATGVENVQNDKVQSTKILEGTQVIIIRNGVRYTIQGQKMN